MEDIIQALLDVVRIQHDEADGTEVEPFNMEDIIDMAMNIIGRPDETDEENALIKEIEGTVESLAPDLFPPKTFDQLDDNEQVASAANMIEQSLLSGMRRQSISRELDSPAPEEKGEGEDAAQHADILSQIDAYNRAESGGDEAEEEFNAGEAADLNNMIYDNIMKMMGLTEPKVEDAFDRSQIRFGKEKTVTELLEEEQQNSAQESAEPARQLSAWELAQNAIDRDIEAHTKEEYVPKPMEIPNTKSASQLATEAIERAKEESDQRSEIEKRADALMEEARKQGKDPMQFALHQQEILRYMEKNSDELVSFEDYEDLTPEEKYEIERAIEEEKRQEALAAEAEGAAGAAIPDSSGAAVEAAAEREGEPAGETEAAEETARSEEGFPILSEEMLRRLSQEVIQENADEILAENADENMESLNEAILENIRKMMSGSGVPVHQESVDSLIEQVVAGTGGASARPDEEASDRPQDAETNRTEPERPEENRTASDPGEPQELTRQDEPVKEAPADSSTAPAPMSAADLARAAQDAAGIRRQEEVEENTVSAVELAKAAQEAARRIREAEEAGQNEIDLKEEDLDFDNLDFDLDTEDEEESEAQGPQQESSEGEEISEAQGPQQESAEEGEVSEAQETPQESAEGEEISEAQETSQESAEGGEVSEGQEAPQDSSEGEEAAEPDQKADPEGNPEDDVKEEPAPEADQKTDPDGTPEEAPVESAVEETDADETDEDAGVEPEVFVLGEHTQAEIDEALRNLETLGLEGEVYDRAERLLLLEMAGSEAELDAWLAARDMSEPIPEASPLYDDTLEELSDLDAEEMDKELDLALDEGFLEDMKEEEDAAAEEAGSSQPGEETAEAEETGSTGSDGEAVVTEKAGSAGSDGEEAVTEEAGSAGSDGETATSEDEPAEADGDQSAQPEEREGADPVSEEQAGPDSRPEQNKELQVSVRNPFVLKNSSHFMDQFEDYIQETQENRRLSTGFRKLDTMLRYGLHKGSYFIDSDPQYLKNAFMQQIADRTAENSIDVLYISTELSRYDLMVESVSRLSYEIHRKDGSQAASPMDIMSGREGANLIDLKDELNWYRGRISEHLFIVDQEAVLEMVDSAEEGPAGMILEDLIRSIVREGAHKPVVVIDNLENVMATRDLEDMKPLMDGMRKLASELGIPILMSYGYAQAESDIMVDEVEKDFRRALGNMCDVYLDLEYADMITEDGNPLTREDIRDMAENGDNVLIDVSIRRNRRIMRASCQIQAVPRYNWFTE